MRLKFRPPAVVLCASVLAFALLPAQAADKKAGGTGKQTLTGEISDTMCGAKHMIAGSKADCTRECIKGGSDYALVVGDKVYTLKGHKEELDKLAGERATVSGTISGDTIEVASVSPAKS